MKKTGRTKISLCRDKISFLGKISCQGKQLKTKLATEQNLRRGIKADHL